MTVSSLREVTIGVADLPARHSQLESCLGLSTFATGNVTSTTAWRLFDLPSPHRAAVVGHPGDPDGPRVRLVEAPGLPPARPNGIEGPGPLGIEFSAPGIHEIHSSLQRAGVRFQAPPHACAGDELGAPRLESWGQTEDGDFISLTARERSDAAGEAMGGRPQRVSFVVTNLEASVHFLGDVLEKETGPLRVCSSDALPRPDAEASFRVAAPRRDGHPTGGVLLIEFEKRLTPPPQFASFGRGICRLRYDTTDLHATLARVPGGGGSLVRGPSGIDDPVLGRGLVALVRAPFGVVIELWQTT